MIFHYNRKGQAAAGAAVLLAIIAAIIVTYIILIPPSDRQELLGSSSSSSGGGSSSGKIGTTGLVSQTNLMTVAPGRVDYLAQKDLEHTLPDITLMSRSNSKVLAEKASIVATKGIFSEKKSSFAVTFDDLKNTENVLLTYTPKVAEGMMSVFLNGQEIYSGAVNVKSPKPLFLAKSALEEQNVIEFAVSSPGLAFWRTNELRLEDVRVIGDVQDVEAQVSKSLFSVSDVEKRGMEKAILKFLLDCSELAGKMKVSLNGNEVYSGVPDCSSPQLSFELSPSLFYDGQNTLLFSLDKGSVILSHPKIQTKLKDVVYPTFYFQVSLEQFQAVKNLKKKVYLTADFVEVVDAKTGEFVVNGKVVPFNTKEGKLAIEVTNEIVQGNNAVMIKPQKTLEIRELKADLVNI